MKRLLNQCLQLARQRLGRHPERFKHFSFLIYGRKIVGIGLNKSTGGPIDQRLGYPKHAKLHSELIAIRRAFFRVSCLVNIRLSNNGELRNSKPCECCSAILNLFGITKIYYSTEEGFHKWKNN